MATGLADLQRADFGMADLGGLDPIGNPSSKASAVLGSDHSEIISLVALKLPFAPLMLLGVWIEDPLAPAVQRPHDADPGQHRRAGLRNED